MEKEVHLHCGLELNTVTTESRHNSTIYRFGVHPPKIGVAAIRKPESLKVLDFANIIHDAVCCLHERAEPSVTLDAQNGRVSQFVYP